MTSEEKYIARIMFRNKVLESDGQQFEDFFTAVMQENSKGFLPIKPHGSYGDRKCDGYDTDTGRYFQVYAPEDFQGKEEETVDKMTLSFHGLMDNWDKKVQPVNEYTFVINDKYKGTYPVIHQSLAQITTDHGVDTSLMSAKHLEDIFLDLDDEKIIALLGPIPTADTIDNLEFGIMNQVVVHLQSIEKPYKPEEIPDNIDFTKKIVFNGLTQPVADLLNVGRLQEYAVRDYFELNSDFTRSELRDKFNSIYTEALKVIDESETKNDEVFFYILNTASPSNRKSVQDAVIILMAYYFEYCDIFEAPEEMKQGTFFE